jgi:hypothetical protein
MRLIAGTAIVIAVLVLGAYVLLTRSDMPGGNAEPTPLSDTSRVASDTSSDGAGPSGVPAASQPTATADRAGNPTEPTSAASQSNATATALTDPPVSSPASPSAVLLNEHFANNDSNWPNDPRSSAWFSDGVYHIEPRQAGRFVAISAPIVNLPGDVVISATFRKLGGPAGGGYGIIVRDQDDGVRDGTTQNGHYYVLEVGDIGEVGMWRREADHWVDLLPWQHSDAVKTGTATNQVTVRAVGNALSLVVNGAPVAIRSDAQFTRGQAGLFVGGDGNQVAVSHFTIKTP